MRLTRGGTARSTTIAVTGAAGYIGEALCRLLLARGLGVRALSRHRPPVPGVAHVTYDLREPIPAGALDGVSAVVHLASETKRAADPDSAMELAALGRLLEEARQVDARLVFVSSQTARVDAPTAYGRLKWRAEQMTLAQGGVVVRPGQVYGGSEKALWGRLARLTRNAAVLPRFSPDPLLQPIHVEDLCAALARLAQDRSLPAKVYSIADPSPVALSRFLFDTARFRFGRRLIFFPFPAAEVRLLASVLGPLAPSALKQLRSLLSLPLLESAPDLARLDLQIQPFPDGVARANARRSALLREGRVLMKYLLGTPPDRQSLKSYVRTIEATDDPRPLDLPAFVIRTPRLIALFDQPAARARAGDHDRLTSRLDLALVLAEGTPAHADRFLLAPTRARRLAQAAEVTTAGLMEALMRLSARYCKRKLDRRRRSLVMDDQRAP